ncbi:hypothetical protein D3C76_963540 [compost metagenome]
MTELHLVATRYGILHKGSLIALHSAQEMEHQCRPSIKIKHDENVGDIVSFLRDKGVIQILIEGNDIIISDTANVPKELLSMLVKANYRITEYYYQQETLEDYFVRLTRTSLGDQNV